MNEYVKITGALLIGALTTVAISEYGRRGVEVIRAAPTPAVNLEALTAMATQAVNKLDNIKSSIAQSMDKKPEQKIVYKTRTKIQYKTRVVTQTRYIPVNSPVIVPEPRLVRVRMEQKRKFCNVVINHGLRVQQCVSI